MSVEVPKTVSMEEQKEMEDKVTTKMKNKQLPTAVPDKMEVTGNHIPNPQDLPQRKPSLAASKLAG
uniref:Uncharacterized protein n=1 Tax=Oryctolagus cuniculus TaxID=9986 RepID=A0A5F9DMH0_RABIT